MSESILDDADCEPVTDGPVGCVCGDCQTFPFGWHGSNWKCRTADRCVNPDDRACSRWHQRAPFDFAAERELNRARAELVDTLFSSYAVSSKAYVPKPPPPGLRGCTDGVVYFIDCCEFTKIGHTHQWVENRIKGIATHNPFPLRLWALIRGLPAFEREFHTVLADYRHANEWFRLPPKVKSNIRAFVKDHGGEVYHND